MISFFHYDFFIPGGLAAESHHNKEMGKCDKEAFYFLVQL